MVKRKTNEEFLKEVSDNYNEEYTILSEYKNARTKISIRHEKCGEVYERRPDSIKNITCKSCSRRRYTHSDIIKKIKDIVGNEYTLLGKYKTMEKPIKMIHNLCNYEWDVKLHHFINNGTRCPKCFGNIKRDTESYRKEVYVLYKDEYSVLGEYIDTHSPIKMIHNLCNLEFEVRPSDFLGSHMQGCPKCKASKGERLIRNWLSENNISFEEQVKMDGLRNKIPLTFDFFLPDYNTAIEFDGIQHFKPVKRFGGEERFKIQQKRDSIKNQFCKENEIRLIRIPYFKIKNISLILSNLLEVTSSTTIETTSFDGRK
ncbi:hypothetical protein Goe21_02240 [Bacillus phage vB_BsuM-Goe21]|nr:hypothetical protein Goe21_02240 [Bacillus phage vB_BsuM-Goe21]